jgi:hypothetical protein
MQRFFLLKTNLVGYFLGNGGNKTFHQDLIRFIIIFKRSPDSLLSSTR